MNRSFTRVHEAIADSGQLSSFRSAYTRRNMDLYGLRHELSAAENIAALSAKPGTTLPKSTVVVVGTAPSGFGKQVLWHPDDAALAVVVFLAAGDSLGVMISGAKKSDTLEVVSAVGIASFAEETTNRGVGAFIGIVAAGSSAAVTAFGAPEVAPIIGAAEQFAKTQFSERQVKTKRRDPFGEDPSNGHKAREEGGVIVSLPDARQIFYSGNDDHQERWIKKPGTRDRSHFPTHVRNAFFLRGGIRNVGVAGVDGDFIIAPWDYDFTDNFGYYRLHVLLRRGTANRRATR